MEAPDTSVTGHLKGWNCSRRDYTDQSPFIRGLGPATQNGQPGMGGPTEPKPATHGESCLTNLLERRAKLPSGGDRARAPAV